MKIVSVFIFCMMASLSVYSCEKPAKYYVSRDVFLTSNDDAGLLKYLTEVAAGLDASCPFEMAKVNADLMVVEFRLGKIKNANNTYLKAKKNFMDSYKNEYMGVINLWDLERAYNSILYRNNKIFESISKQSELVSDIKKTMDTDIKKEFYTIYKYHLVNNLLLLSKMYLNVDCDVAMKNLNQAHDNLDDKNFVNYKDMLNQYDALDLKLKSCAR